MNRSKISRRSTMKFGLGAVLAGPLVPIIAKAGETGEQPMGPFFPNPGTPIREIREDSDPRTPIYLANDADLTFVNSQTQLAKGQHIFIKGKLLRKDGSAVSGANIIIWQASSSGRYNHNGDQSNIQFSHPKTGRIIRRELDPNFQYWGKAVTDDNGNYLFKTIVPGFYPADLTRGWFRPPHIHMLVSAMGIPQFVTQLYFQGDINEAAFVKELNDMDPLLQDGRLSEEQRSELIVDIKRQESGDLRGEYLGLFDIELPQ